MNDWIIRGFEVKTAHSAMAGNSNQLVVMNGTYLMKSRYKIPALVYYLGSVKFKNCGAFQAIIVLLGNVLILKLEF